MLTHPANSLLFSYPVSLEHYIWGVKVKSVKKYFFLDFYIIIYYIICGNKWE